MRTDIASILASIDTPALTAIARQVLRREAFQMREWHMHQLGGGAGNPVSVGLYRFEGAGEAHAEPLTWSVILKVLQSPANAGWVGMGEGEDQTHWNYWKREVLVYTSSLLETLPPGLAAPRCYAAAERPGEVALLWLEDVHDAYRGAWPLERYALAARHIGRLNGLYLSARPLPDLAWLGRQRNRQWLAGNPHWQTLPWDHPHVRARYPQASENFFRRLLGEPERFLAKLDRLPQTLCHGDPYPTNLMSRPLADGQEATVALDWALTGIQPLGEDLGQLVYGAQMNLPAAKPAEVTDALFDSYLAGLRDSGCRVEPLAVRFGFAASAALRIGLFQVLLLGEALKQGAAQAEDGAAPAAGPECFEVALAREAYALLESIG